MPFSTFSLCQRFPPECTTWVQCLLDSTGKECRSYLAFARVAAPGTYLKEACSAIAVALVEARFRFRLHNRPAFLARWALPILPMSGCDFFVAKATSTSFHSAFFCVYHSQHRTTLHQSQLLASTFFLNLIIKSFATLPIPRVQIRLPDVPRTTHSTKSQLRLPPPYPINSLRRSA